MTSGVYQIKNLTNGKIYIGSSKNIELRFNQHKKSVYKLPLYADMAELGLEAFEFSILEELPDADTAELHKEEQKYIDALKPFYNSRKANTGIEISQNDDFNEYHRLYLETQEEYNKEHKEYCRKWYKEHKDYFKKYYLEHKK